MFGEPPARSDSSAVEPAAVSDELRLTAGRLPARLRMGTSSWSFPGWDGLVYSRAPAQRHLARGGLGAYARHPLLRAVGVDRTFYAPISSEQFAEYAAAVPADFRFLVKACRACTTPFGEDGATNALYLEPGFATDEVVAPLVQGLAAKAGPLVFQFPPQGPDVTREPVTFAKALASFLGALPRGPAYAVELRDAALLTPAYAEALAACGARHCYALHPRMPDLSRQRELMAPLGDGPLVVRWMLRRGLGYEQARRRYAPFSRLVDEDPKSRTALAELCLDHLRGPYDVVVVVNNKAEGSAPLSVFELARELAAELPPSP